ncbi:YchJ family protein [Sulfurimonas paralvinellae]|uniref:YchJ family protein n=1 Tax=Sulfurimonas paralvinellae TaxID=317658 RepID=A0A7M1B671_9BACT|nr:YchJ family protein [Sulfurimonas paralvinellae]QOP45214.1 YchJ family protein [Sulfurimonas paralvinellae]
MCICGKSQDFSKCCEPLILKKELPKSPEALMCSRYSAYVIGNGDYLVYSAVQQNRYADDIALIEEFSNSVEWLKLDVLHTKENQVEFKAYYRDNKGIQVLHEKSTFVKIDDEWKYKDGELFNTKIERNGPCPCGSGKKYKKCCMKN